jgi:phosphatidylglycerol:prolipoprotein diacylglycerol transferase
MPDITTALGPIVLRTYTFALAVGFLLAVAVAVYRLRRVARPGAVVDVLLIGLIGAAAGARLAHVLLNPDYFGAHADEMWRLSAGGLDWHGGLIGGLVGLAARWRRVPLSSLLDALAPALPLLALAGWYGCWAAACGYGAEVDTLARYPSYIVSEARDVYGIVAPRYNTQVFGIIAALVVFIIELLLERIRRLASIRFWLVLALLSGSMFAIGFARGDFSPVVSGLRLDQWLDLALIIVCVVIIARDRVLYKAMEPPGRQENQQGRV